MKKIFISAGEKSGDIHASNLIKAIKQIDPDTAISGLGGPEMQNAGCRLLYNMMDISVIGFVEVLKHIKIYKKLFYDTIDNILKINPDCIIFVDYPGFNLRLAKKIKELMPDIKLIYYISPQIWAWHKSRIHLIKKIIDKMIVIFPFEIDFYKTQGYDKVFFGGHPILDISFFSNIENKSKQKNLIGIMPGSRISEIKRNLPSMLKVYSYLKNEKDFEIAAANEKCRQYIQDYLGHVNEKITFAKDSHDLIGRAEFIITASGTVTVEIAAKITPMVIMYKVKFFTWLIAKLLVKIKYIGMVNIIADKMIVPEFIQFDIKPKKIADYICILLSDENRYNKAVEELKAVRNRLGVSGASQKNAKEILGFLK